MGQGILRGVNESMVYVTCHLSHRACSERRSLTCLRSLLPNAAQVQTVSSAFPDIPRENILYDLSKTRNVQSTFERILEVGTLPAVSPSPFARRLSRELVASLPWTSLTSLLRSSTLASCFSFPSRPARSSCTLYWLLLRPHDGHPAPTDAHRPLRTRVPAAVRQGQGARRR